MKKLTIHIHDPSRHDPSRHDHPSRRDHPSRHDHHHRLAKLQLLDRTRIFKIVHYNKIKKILFTFIDEN
jgi:hypothetical protein